MNKNILKTAIVAVLAISSNAQAFTVTPGLKDPHLMPNGERLSKGMTIDEGKFYRLRGGSNTPEIINKFGKQNEIGINIYDRDGTQVGRFPHSKGNALLNLGSHKGNIITSFRDSDATKITRYDTTAIDEDGKRFTKVTQYNIDFGERNVKASSSIAFDSENEVFYFQKQGTNRNAENLGDIYKYELSSGNLELFSTQLKQPGKNDTTIGVNVTDMEFVNGALWILEDSNGQAARTRDFNNDTVGIFKIKADGTLAGFDKFDAETTGFDMDNGSIGGFDFDEELGAFLIESELDWGGADERNGIYLAKVEGLSLDLGAVAPPSQVPLPAAFPLFGAAVAGLGFVNRRRKQG